MDHRELARRACTWLHNNQRVWLIEREANSAWLMEIPDVIGWTCSGTCYVIECKVSRADFMRDRKKVYRLAEYAAMEGEASQAGVEPLGNYRYYAAPRGLIKPNEIPEHFGLLEVCGGGLRAAKHPTCVESNEKAERILLIQLARMRWLTDGGQHHVFALNRDLYVRPTDEPR